MDKGDVSNVVVTMVKERILMTHRLPKDHPMVASTWVSQTGHHSISIACGHCSGCHTEGWEGCMSPQVVTEERDELMCILPMASIPGLTFYCRKLIPKEFIEWDEKLQFSLVQAFVFEMVYEIALKMRDANRELAKASSQVHHLAQALTGH